MSVDAAQFFVCKNPMNCLLSMNKSARQCVFLQSVKHDKLDFRTFVWKRTSNSYNISSFEICSRLTNVWKHIYILKAYLKICEYVGVTPPPHSQSQSVTWYVETSRPRGGETKKKIKRLDKSTFWSCLILLWQRGPTNTAEIISKVMMKLSLTNSNNNFDFFGRVIKTTSLFYFRSVKFHYVKETHMMLVVFWRWWKLLQHLSTKDNERNLSKDLLTIENTDWDLKCMRCNMQMSYLSASDFSFKNFCKLAEQAETIRNYQKQFLVRFEKLAN